VGKLLAYLKEPSTPWLKDAWEKWPVLEAVLNMVA